MLDWRIEPEGEHVPSSEVPGAEAFSVSVECRDTFIVVSAVGELDVYTSTSLRETLDSVLGDGAEHLVVDLTGLGFMDSSGIGVLIGAKKKIQELSHGSFAVVCREGGPVLRLLTLTGLVHVLNVHDTRDAAFLGASGDASELGRS